MSWGWHITRSTIHIILGAEISLAKLILNIGYWSIFGAVRHDGTANSWAKLLTNMQSIFDNCTSVGFLIPDDCVGLRAAGTLAIGISSLSYILKFPLITPHVIGMVNSSVWFSVLPIPVVSRGS
jgi:hypothetical protein